MGELLNRGTGAAGAEPVADDIAPLLRWALREQVRGQEPSDAVWQGVKVQVAAPRYFVHTAHHLATVVSALVVAALALTVGVSDNGGSEQVIMRGQSEEVTEIVEPTPARVPTFLPGLTQPTGSTALVVRAEPVEPASLPPAAIQQRTTKPAEAQDDALKPERRLRLTALPPAGAPPGSIVYTLVRGQSARPN